MYLRTARAILRLTVRTFLPPCLALLLVALAACERLIPGRGPGTGRGVLLIAIDSLRADHVSSLGYDRETTPALDRLAAEGISFTQAFSSAPWLLPAHVSLLTGCDPFIAIRYLPENIQPSMVTLWNVPDTAPRLALEFLRNGYATAAFSDHPWVSQAHGLDAGFQRFREYRSEPGMDASDFGIQMAGVELQNWLQEQSADRNWFAYVHLHDLERAWREGDPRWDAYFAPRPELDWIPPIGSTEHAYDSIPRRNWRGALHTLGQYEAQYDGAIRHLDEELQRLFSRLEQIRRLENTTVAVVGTFGVGLGEGRVYLDHGVLADVDLHVPWILRPASGIPGERGCQTRALASLLDVGPTLLELEGLPVPAGMQGFSQGPVVAGTAQAVRAHAVARCGFQNGFVVMNERYCYERTLPYSVRDHELSVSWHGTPQAPEHVREVLHDRERDASIGHLASSAGEDQALLETLLVVGNEWIKSSLDLRQRLQKVTWPEPADPSWMGGQLVTGGSPGSPP